ncbi:MAG: type II secretion system protein M [Deltaproteobacteria bacterium]|nr:type II secretion system protein M [Deltaproteobacteria bacterium]
MKTKGNQLLAQVRSRLGVKGALESEDHSATPTRPPSWFSVEMERLGSNLRTFWEARTTREKGLIGLLGGMLAVMILVSLVSMVVGWRGNLDERVETKREEVAQARLLAQQMALLEQSPQERIPEGPPGTVVGTLAQRMGAGDRITVTEGAGGEWTVRGGGLSLDEGAFLLFNLEKSGRFRLKRVEWKRGSGEPPGMDVELIFFDRSQAK